MEEQWTISYKSTGGNSYLEITFPENSPIIGYQLEMIVSNDIKNFLKSMKKQVNGELVISYNISSKIQLSQILERRKLKKEEVIRLLNGIAEAVADGEEYQLAEEGIMMDPEYIYVSPDTCSPEFVYIPLEENTSMSIKEFFSSLIMNDRLEMSSDNFLQILLGAINHQPFSVAYIKEELERYENRAKPVNSSVSKPVMPERVLQESIPRESVPQESIPKESMSYEPVQQEVHRFPENKPEKKNIEKPVPGNRSGVAKPPAGKKKAEQPSEVIDQTDLKSEKDKAKKKFVIPQAFILVALSAMISFNVLTDIKVILSAVIIIGVFEIILYREVFINNKKLKAAKAEKGEKVGTAEKALKTGKPIPKKAASGKINRPELPNAKQMELPQETREREWPKKPVMASSPVPVRYEIPKYTELFEEEIDEKTEVWEGDFSRSAYLEFTENGFTIRVTLDRNSTLIGRLADQVDFPVKNPKVGRIHAEFINKDGTIYVRDQNSKNGTYLNGESQRINSNTLYPLKDGDRICLADSEFILRCGR